MSGINFGNPLSGLLPGLGGSKPGLPGGPQPPGLNLPGGIDAPPGHGGLPPGQNGPDGLSNPGGNNGLPGGDPYSPGASGPGTPTATPDAVSQPNAPLLNPDNPASRLLQGQSPSANNSSYSNPFNANSPTQYPPPTLSERALVNAPQFGAGDRVAVNYGVMPASGNAQGAVVQGQGLPQTASGALPPSVGSGAGAGAAANSAAAASTTSNAAAPALTLVNTATPNAVAAAPMAAATSQEALLAQQNLLARMAGQHAPAAGNTAANAAPPPSETSATLPAVGSNAAHNDPRSLPLGGNERAAQQRGDAPNNALVYTGDGAPRRAQRRGAGVDNATLTHWLWRFGRGGAHRPSREAEPELEALRALQWLFWVLTVVAYASLAMAVVLMLPAGSLISERASPAGSGLALFLAVVVAAGAWVLGRRIRRSR
ncbi:hypothetical protein [Lysobacter enzymogenes]|uniref:hypothetical protein n=1 Tax=Lysobacter enzymogenes TaxID=69 RepID=UPI001A95745F|nr:hypothetical protein [Lysobacter enzymogenes]QQP94669.1 hypothetical protein JHW38_15575 [Lysobacter enzymogenes]